MKAELARRLAESNGYDAALNAEIAVELYSDTGHEDVRENTHARLPRALDGVAPGSYWVVAFSGMSLRQAPDFTGDRTLKRLALTALAPTIMGEIMAEVAKATRKFPTWPTRIIDAGNVVSEEAGELAKACLQVTYEKEKETLDGVRTEAVQTAAMCIRFLASMDVYDTSPGEQHHQRAIEWEG